MFVSTSQLVDNKIEINRVVIPVDGLLIKWSRMYWFLRQKFLRVLFVRS